MASARQKPNGSWVLQISFSGSRSQIHLGKISEADASFTSAMINRLVEYRKSQANPGAELQVWLKSIPDSIAERLADIGLIENRHRFLTVSGLVELFLESYNSLEKIQATTKTVVRSCLARLPGWARTEKLTSIDSEFIERLDNFNLKTWGQATVSRTHGVYLQMGLWAVRRGFCESNPFAGLQRYSTVNENNDFYVEVDVAKHIISVSRDPDLRACIALARFGGLRIISEVIDLQWSAYKPDDNVIVCRKSKRKKTSAQSDLFKAVPLFPYLDSILVEHWELTAETSEYIITPSTLRSTDTALRNKLKKAVKRATGNTCWVRPWDNLRHSYTIDVRKSFGVEEGAAITGHTPATALKHYRTNKANRIDIEKAINSGLFGK